MKFLTDVQTIQLFCEKTNAHGVRLFLSEDDEDKAKRHKKTDDFMIKLETSEILKNLFSRNESKDNKYYNQMTWSTQGDRVIFGEEKEILEIIKIFEEIGGRSYHYHNPEKMIIRLLNKNNQYETFNY